MRRQFFYNRKYARIGRIMIQKSKMKGKSQSRTNQRRRRYFGYRQKPKMRFVWVDDEPSREEVAQNLGKALDVNIDFKGVNKIKVEDKLNEVLQSTEPNLVILDHSLDRAISDTYKTGSTAASVIREKWPKCPIISVTAIDAQEVDVRHREAYEEMFRDNRISENYNSILAIAEGFKQMRANEPRNIDELINYFKPPEDEIEKFKKILPKELKENFNDNSLLSETYRWGKNILFARPGFLYDRLWAATLLGLNIEGFRLVEDKFESAKYNGIFSTDNKERWWKNKLYKVLNELVETFGSPWIIGRELVGDDERYFSKCYSSGEDYPEIVAAEDDTPNAKWYPMKIKETEPHEKFENMLFFEELRIMKPNE